MKEILNQYQNGETVVTIFSDGTKERDISKGIIAEYPESLDVKITNWCDNPTGCATWCHEKSNKMGKNGDLQPTIDLLKQLPAGVEIAIGGGSPLDHPEFDNFVKELSCSGIICNVTVSEYHFNKQKDHIERLISDRLVYGVGYSYSSIPCNWDYEHLVTHVIVGTVPYFDLDKIVEYNNKKVLLLGFKKKTGRGDIFYRKNNALVDNNIKTWYAGLFNASKKAHLSFDNLAISQLNPSRLFKEDTDYQKMFMGKDGMYSMYMDAVTQTFSVSSTGVDRYNYLSSISEMFHKVTPKEVVDICCA